VEGFVERRNASRLLALSFDGPSSPAFGLQAPGGSATPLGWGLAWYPGQQPAALVLKDTGPVGDNPLLAALRGWERFNADTFVAHVRGATSRNTEADTQPFVRSHAGRDWVFAHAGSFTPGTAPEYLPAFEPVGRTDSERLFCWLMGLVAERGARSLADVGWERLHEWFRVANDRGVTNLLLSDGIDLAAYQDRYRLGALSWVRRVAPHAAITSDELSVNLGGDDARHRSLVAVGTAALADSRWRPMAGSQLLVLRAGAVRWDSHAGAAPELGPAPPLPQRARVAEPRLVSVVHESVYHYSAPVERSTHLLKLQPVRDLLQDPLEHEVTISVPALRHEFEDVFGNRAVMLQVDAPYTEFRVTSRSLVRVLEPPPLAGAAPRRVVLPLVWMPWQRQMLSPYLLPPELSESQLEVLTGYAMGFARRQDNDLVETLCDMNAAIYRDFTYVPGETHIDTTPFEFFERRRGVCQDFANLLICLARLLNIPARYRVGYLFTGADYQNKIQSEASHAWAELYLPEHGWHGFDPTNGRLVGTDHVRVAAGRHYRDAAPISGTIFTGGGAETLAVHVKVEEAAEASIPAW
jgi:transglutaminase-like putative cysteine protease/predicted glutamine amidotransferase